MTKKSTVAILFGGRSVEHEISVRSAANVAANINRDLYHIILIGIDKQGSWYLKEEVERDMKSGQKLGLKLDAKAPSLIILESGEEIQIDIAFPALHGTDGEDGSIQGLFKTLDIPVVGSGVLGSAISMDKIISKKILLECGVPVADYLEFHKSQTEHINFEQIKKKLGIPFMIKSASLGSSVGVSMVKSAAEFSSALAESFKYDEKIIIERYVKGRELECAVIGNLDAKASYPGEIVLIKDYDFYTYTAKYLDENAIKIQLPAEIDEESTKKIRAISVQAYKALRCEDFARVDLFLTDKGEILVNEINTIPGFTSASMFPMMWQHMGLTYEELITELINMCLKRYNDAKNLETHYNVTN